MTYSSPFTSHSTVTKAQLDQLVANDNDLLARIADTGWTALTVSNSGFQAGAVATQWRQVGALVQIGGTLSRTTGNDLAPSATTWTANVFAVLPSSARPATPQEAPQVVANLAGGRMEMKVDTDGGVSFRNTGTANVPAAANFGCYITYLAG